MSRIFKRESAKAASLETDRRVFQLRYRLGDYDAVHLSEADSIAQKSPKSFERSSGSKKVRLQYAFRRSVAAIFPKAQAYEPFS